MNDLGYRIRYVRKSVRLPLKDLSALTDLSVGYLSQVENGLKEPSLSALKKISDSLNTTISFLVNEDDIDVDRTLVKANERTSVKSPHAEEGVLIERLAEFNPDNDMEVCVHILQPNSESGAVPYEHEGQETFFVIEGKIKLKIAGEIYYLEKGDCYYLRDCFLEHSFSNVSEEKEAHVMCISTPPFFYGSPKQKNEKIKIR